MEAINSFLDDANEVYDDLRNLYGEKELLDEEIAENQEKVEDNVIMALYTLQDSLEEHDEVVLMESTETGRGGFYSFREILNSEGVVARLDDSEYGNECLYTWPGNWDRIEEPLDVESEYLVGDRDTPGFIKKLHSRLENLEGKIPESKFFYD